MICDILAGERGPSCKKMGQILQPKVFCVGFIKKQNPAEDEENDTDPDREQVRNSKMVVGSYTTRLRIFL